MKYNRGFTLVELLMVITIIAIIVGLSVPLFTNISQGLSQGTISPNQLKEDLFYARQYARVKSLDTYIIFANTNYANTNIDGIFLSTNLLPYQSYCMISYGQVSDQPGVHSFHQIGDWKELSNQVYVNPSSLTGKPFVIQAYSPTFTNNPLPIVNLGDVSFPCVWFGGVDGMLYYNVTNIFLMDGTLHTNIVRTLKTNDVVIPLVYGPHYYQLNPASTNAGYTILEINCYDGFVNIHKQHIQ